jgi:hypothetical protein
MIHVVELLFQCLRMLSFKREGREKKRVPLASYSHLPTSSQMDSQEIDLWVTRAVRYYTVVDAALQPLRENLAPTVFIDLHTQASVEWAEEQSTNPRIRFQPGDREAQETFYQTLDGICESLSSVKENDYKA